MRRRDQEVGKVSTCALKRNGVGMELGLSWGGRPKDGAQAPVSCHQLLNLKFICLTVLRFVLFPEHGQYDLPVLRSMNIINSTFCFKKGREGK